MDDKRMLAPKEVAALLAVSESTIYRQLREDPNYLGATKVGGLWRFPADRVREVTSGVKQ